MSYFRYWREFVLGASQIVEPIPLNRYATSAAGRTFNNIATALLLQGLSQKAKRKLFYAGEVRSAFANGALSEADFIEALKRAYRTAGDPAGAYGLLVEQLWGEYRTRFQGAGFRDWIWDIHKPHRHDGRGRAGAGVACARTDPIGAPDALPKLSARILPDRAGHASRERC
jgi:hypothetical protein